MATARFQNISIHRPLNVLFVTGDGFSQAVMNALNVPSSDRVKLTTPIQELWNPCKNPDGKVAGSLGPTWCRSLFPILAECVEKVRKDRFENATLYEIAESVRTYVDNGGGSAELFLG